MSRSPQELAERLSAWLPDGSRLTRVRPASIGFSNETYFLDGCDFVLRMPPSGAELLPPYDVMKQYDVLSGFAARSDAPIVPQPVARCDDTSVLGVPFYVMEWAHGDTFEQDMPEWFIEMEPAGRAHMCAQWIDAIGTMHLQTPLPALGEALSPEQEVAYWRERAGSAEAGSLVDLLDELAKDPAPTSGEPGVVHGDPKFANLVWRGSSLVALLDFEMTHNGEPLVDVGYLLYHFSELPIAAFAYPGMFDRAEALSAWETVTGREIVALPWYEALGYAKIAAINAYAGYLHKTGQTTDERFLMMSLGAPLFEDMARRALDA